MNTPAAMLDALAEARRAVAAGEWAEYWIETSPRLGRAIYFRPAHDNPCPYPFWQEFDDDEFCNPEGADVWL